MKKANSLRLIYLLATILPLFTACEKVIELDLDTKDKELVIDANIDWEKGATGQEQTIQLSYTQPYYSQEAPEGASGASVLVADNQGNIFPFVEYTAGTYKNLNFSPVLGRRYALVVQHQGKEYVASDVLKEVPQLTEDNITQSNDGGFTRDQIMLTLRFDANAGESNNFVLHMGSMTAISLMVASLPKSLVVVTRKRKNSNGEILLKLPSSVFLKPI